MNDRAIHPIVSRPRQARFLTIPQAPLCYWLPEGILAAIDASVPSVKLTTSEGLGTRKDERFVRFVWETANSRRWQAYSKGGGYSRWFGHDSWNVEWENNGVRVKGYISEHYPPEKFTLLIRHERLFGKARLVYSTAGRGSLGVRTAIGPIPGDAGPAVFVEGVDLFAALGLLNASATSYCLRGLTAGGINLKGFYVSLLPIHLARKAEKPLAAFANICATVKRHLVAPDPTERSFGGISGYGTSLAEAWRRAADDAEAVAAVLHTLEGLSEREVFAAYGIDGADLQAVLDETGTPAGWFPVITGYDAIPALPPGLDVPAALPAPLSREPRRALSAEELAGLKRRLLALYEAGPGAKFEEGETDASGDNDEEESEPAASGARIPIPAETFLEELAQKLEVHPISVYWLLRGLREKDGAVCQPELQRFVEDHVSVLVLRLLGHRWPGDFEAGQPPPAGVDGDGVITLTDGTSEAPLLARIRDRLAEHFGHDHVGAVEREFEEVVGRPLGAWLASDFFRRHISQFRKRPIALQIVNLGGNSDRRRGRGAGRNAPAFSCLVYYHRLDADLLPKLRTQYVGPLRTTLQTELGSLDKVPKRSADQDVRRLELEEKLEELKALDARLERVITEGFASAALNGVAAKEPLDPWTSRNGRAPAPATRDALLAQERRYDPDLNDGVRVNIAPLQRAGLLAADVLGAKDLEKAIADRAEWRADERRWCREGKLARPGWWPEGAAETKPPAARHSNGKVLATKGRA